MIQNPVVFKRPRRQHNYSRISKRNDVKDIIKDLNNWKHLPSELTLRRSGWSCQVIQELEEPQDLWGNEDFFTFNLRRICRNEIDKWLVHLLVNEDFLLSIVRRLSTMNLPKWNLSVVSRLSKSSKLCSKSSTIKTSKIWC